MCFLPEQFLLNFARFGRPIQSIAVLFLAYKHKSMICHLCRLYTAFDAPWTYFVSISLHQSTRDFSWTFVRLCGIQREQIFFTGKYPGNILLMLAILVSKDASISRHVTWWSCFISSLTISIFSGTKTDFVRISFWIEHWPQLNSLYQLFTMLYDDASSL